MKRIRLHSLTIEKFRSFRERTTLIFSEGEGFRFMAGENKVEPRLGANGAGKSTIWDALVYCLTGSSIRGLRASDLVTWGEKTPYVRVDWFDRDERLWVERYGNPDRLTINGTAVEQWEVDQQFGLSRGRLLHSAIFGQAVPLFIDLPVPDRGKLLDEALDLGLWLRAADTAGKHHAKAERDLEEINREIAYCTGKIEGAESLDALDAAIEQWEDEHEARINKAIDAVAALEDEIPTLKQTIQEKRAALAKVSDAEHLEKQVRIYQKAKADREAEYREFFKQLQGIQKQIQFYTHTRNCPECGQTVSAAYARERLGRMETLKRDVELALSGNGAQTKLAQQMLDEYTEKADKERRKHEFLRDQHVAAMEALRAHERVIEGAAATVETIADATNPHHERREILVREIEATQARLKTAQATRRQLQARLLRLDFWRAAFKRVRLFLVRRVLAQLEVEASSAANALGLVGWKIEFTTELETKTGNARPGIHVKVQSPTASAPWEAWSGGEGQRIRLAVTLGLSSLIQRMAGVSLQFEVWDEPSAWLSVEGIEDLLTFLRARAHTLHKSVWLCDHRGLNDLGFDEVWTVCKTEKGSSLSLLSKMEN